MTDYIVYYRASTEKQRDGLGLDAQKQAITRFLENYGGNIIDTVEEIVSGGAQNREGFTRALYLAKETGATLLVHRIDRLSRSGFMTIALLEQEGVNFIEADAPNDSAFSKNIKFLVAKEEKEKIQSRVKGALAEINTKIAVNGFHLSKAGNKITSLGTPENLSDVARRNSITSRRNKALNNPNNRKAFSVVELMEGKSLRGVASFLNANGFLTSTGKQFAPTSVSNLKKLYA
jgi:DNA invertase Pin-like site-specific DNA recombinase